MIRRDGHQRLGDVVWGTAAVRGLIVTGATHAKNVCGHGSVEESRIKISMLSKATYSVFSYLSLYTIDGGHLGLNPEPLESDSRTRITLSSTPDRYYSTLHHNVLSTLNIRGWAGRDGDDLPSWNILVEAGGGADGELSGRDKVREV